MEISIRLKSAKDDFKAEGIYSGGKVIVKKGSRIQLSFASNFKGAAIVRSVRNNRKLVDEKGIVLCDCVFPSPSTAAQFITGRSSNGYVAWRTKNQNLGQYLGRNKTKGSKESY